MSLSYGEMTYGGRHANGLTVLPEAHQIVVSYPLESARPKTQRALYAAAIRRSLSGLR